MSLFKFLPVYFGEELLLVFTFNNCGFIWLFFFLFWLSHKSKYKQTTLPSNGYGISFDSNQCINLVLSFIGNSSNANKFTFHLRRGNPSKLLRFQQCHRSSLTWRYRGKVPVHFGLCTVRKIRLLPVHREAGNFYIPFVDGMLLCVEFFIK